MNTFEGRTRIAGTAIIIMLVILSPAIILASEMGESGGYDLDDLLARAEKAFDFAEHDAVLLLESRHLTLTADGDLKTRVHRVVWIGTSRGIRDHADLRVPWNSASSKLEVVRLRTWRDGAWWPDADSVSGTAVVETLPHALVLADDYSSMRETMLLHDGVELPCVMETVYEITETGACTEGCDGVFVMRQNDPAMLVEFTLETPDDVHAVFRSGNGAPGPESGDSGGRAIEQSWTMEEAGRKGSPILEDAASYAPYVAWTTWGGWDVLGAAIDGMFERGSSLEGSRVTLDPILNETMKGSDTPFETVDAIAALIEDYVRNIHYPSDFWMFRPREAGRVWDTAYGTSLDRGVLAAALFEKAGMDVRPFIVSLTPDQIDLDIPGLSRFGDIRLIVYAEDETFVYDPSSGSLETPAGAGTGYTCWTPEGGGAEMPVYMEGDGTFATGLDLELGEGGVITGTGYLMAGGMLSPAYEIAAAEDGSAGFFSDLSSSIITGLEAVLVYPDRIDASEVSARFTTGSKTFPNDDDDMLRLLIGEPAGGIADRLPHDLHLYQSHRAAPVFLRAPVTQKVEFTLDIGERAVIHLPESYELRNGAGVFRLLASVTGSEVVVERSLELVRGEYSPEDWPLLRELLLEEADERHRTVIVR